MKTKIKLAWSILRYFFSFRYLIELNYLLLYYSINHVRGICKINRGKNVKIRPTVLLRDAERIFLGDNTMLNHGNILWAGKKNAKIILGKNVIVGPNVQMIAFNHGFTRFDIPIVDQDITEKDIIIDDNVWVGAGSILLAGAKIGEGSIIAAGSVVTKELPKFSVCGGVPARVLKVRE